MLTSPTLMANIANILKHPEMLKALLGAGLVASEAVKGKKNKGARAGLMIGNAIMGMFGEDSPFKDPLKDTIFSDASEGIDDKTQKNSSSMKIFPDTNSDILNQGLAQIPNLFNFS